jgi:hypothetical protein
MPHVGDKVGQLDDVGEGGLGGGKARAQVGEDLPCLRGRVAFADDFAVRVERDLS